MMHQHKLIGGQKNDTYMYIYELFKQCFGKFILWNRSFDCGNSL